MDAALANFLLNFDKANKGFVHRNKKENNNAAIIVETRRMFFFPLVVRNVMNLLGEDYNLYIFGAQDNIDYIKDSFKDWRFNLASITSKVGNVENYNKFITSTYTWERIKEENIFIFQSDVLLFSDNIKDFEQYDMIGAPCGDIVGDNFTYNGGLSFRKKSKMIECIKEFSREPNENEDVFFSKNFRKMNTNLPDLKTSGAFSAETDPRSLGLSVEDVPLGVHKTDGKYMRSSLIDEWVYKAEKKLGLS